MTFNIDNNENIEQIYDAKKYTIPDNNNLKRGAVKITGFWEGVDGTLYADMGETVHALFKVNLEYNVPVISEHGVAGGYSPSVNKVFGVQVIKRHTFNTLTELIQFYKIHNMDLLLDNILNTTNREPHMFRKYINMYEPDPSRHTIRRERNA